MIKRIKQGLLWGALSILAVASDHWHNDRHHQFCIVQHQVAQARHHRYQFEQLPLEALEKYAQKVRAIGPLSSEKIIFLLVGMARATQLWDIQVGVEKRESPSQEVPVLPGSMAYRLTAKASQERACIQLMEYIHHHLPPAIISSIHLTRDATGRDAQGTEGADQTIFSLSILIKWVVLT